MLHMRVKRILICNYGELDVEQQIEFSVFDNNLTAIGVIPAKKKSRQGFPDGFSPHAFCLLLSQTEGVAQLCGGTLL
jgi:hypothetical protein